MKSFYYFNSGVWLGTLLQSFPDHVSALLFLPFVVGWWALGYTSEPRPNARPHSVLPNARVAPRSVESK